MTKIEWTNETLNIITGCTKHSEGCQNCYAEKMHKRLSAMGQKKYKKPFNCIVFHDDELNRKIKGKNKMVFVNSMSDTFHEKITNEQIDKILNVCGNQPQHQFQILTKRAERVVGFKYPDNVWLGVTVETAKYKKRIEYLRNADARIKFLSCEPLLGDLGELDLTGIDWVIVGGESGHNARPIHPEWVKNIQRQCESQNVAFFFKQWGEWTPPLQMDFENASNIKSVILLNDGSYINGIFPKDVRQYVKQTGNSPDFLANKACIMCKVGKAKAGCKLDGKEYKEYPKEM